MKKIDLSAVAVDCTSSYPPPFDEPCNGQTCQRLGRSQGLKLFGANLTVIPPGSWSSQRHWHSHEDELRKDSWDRRSSHVPSHKTEKSPAGGLGVLWRGWGDAR